MSRNWSRKQFEASYELIRRGKFRHLLHSGQQSFYDYYVENPQAKEMALYTTRKFGKSYLLCVLGIKRCLDFPGQIVRHVLPSLKGAREVLYPIMNEIIPLLPPELRPRLFKSMFKFVFKNGSEYMLGGAAPDSLEGSRGPKCHLLLPDEIGFWDIASYEEALKSVFYPQMSLIEDARTVFATTPPESPDHPFVAETLPPVMAKGAFFKYTVYENPLMTPQLIQDAIDRCGGVESNSFRREYLAELVTDDSLRVIPEFKRSVHTVDEKPSRRDFFGGSQAYVGYTAMDTGVGQMDFTGLLFGYLDHNRQKIVVLGEKRLVTPSIEQTAMAWTEGLQEHLPFVIDNIGTIDTWAQVANELRGRYGLKFGAPRKTRVEEAMAYLRNCFENNKIEILSSCSNLIFELENGMWKKSRTDFERTEKVGHMDLTMALYYMLRSVNWKRRPGLATNNFALAPEAVEKHELAYSYPRGLK